MKLRRGKKCDLSYSNLTTMVMGKLIPVGCMEVLPGDRIQHSTSALLRCMPLMAPVMHPMHVKIHHWFVPNRLIWEDWEKFITGGEDGMDASVYPTITLAGAVTAGDLADYLGVPKGVAGLEVSALPFRAYAMIWNEKYRNRDFGTELTIDKTSGPDTTTNTTLKNVMWEKDYFTGAVDNPQLGDEVSLPDAISGNDTVIKIKAGAGAEGNMTQSADTMSGDLHLSDGNGLATGTVKFGTETGLKLDVTVREFREALALQKMAENRQAHGASYKDFLRFLGINPRDSRLDLPEYLGGGKQTIQFSEVLQTGVTTDTNPDGVGNMRGHGIAAMRSNKYRRFFEEHGWVISFISVVPKTIYANGLFKHWNRRTKTDFYHHELASIGMQEILKKEVYAGAALPEDVWGYNRRYHDYTEMPSLVTGEFTESTLNHWHAARLLGAEPTLNEAFLTADPTNRIFASTATDQLVTMAHHNIVARRQMK